MLAFIPLGISMVATVSALVDYLRISDKHWLPPLEANLNDCSLGEIRVGTPKTWRVKVINRSSVVLRLKEVRTGCACTDAHIEKMMLQPGEATNVIGKLKARSKPGEFEHEVVLFFEDDAQRPFAFTLTGSHYSCISMSPDRLDLSPNIDRPRSARAIVRLADRCGTVGEIEIAHLPVGLHARILESNELPTRIEVAVASSQVVPFDDDIVIRAVRQNEQANLPVSVRPVSPIEVHPREVELGVVSRQELPKEVIVKVSGTSIADFSFLKCSVPEHMTFIMHLSGNDGHEFRLGFQDIVERLDLGGIVVIHFLHLASLQEAEMRVPVRGFLWGR